MQTELNDPRVRLTNFRQRVRRVVGKSGLRIGTEKRKVLIPTQLLPKKFEANSRRRIASCPENCDHLAKSAHSPTVLSRAGDQFCYEITKELIVWPALYHEFRERFFGEHIDVLMFRSSDSDIQARCG